VSSEPKPADRCESCAVGVVASHGQGQFCPFINRSRQAGEELYQSEDDANYVWFIREGSVEVTSTDADGRTVREIRNAGQFVGAEERAQREGSAVCSTDAELCGTTREGFDRWRRGDVEA